MKNTKKYNMNIQIYDCAKKTNSTKYSNSNYLLKDLTSKLNTPVSNLKNITTDSDNTFEKMKLIDTASRKKYNSKLDTIKKSNKLLNSIKTLKPFQQTKTQNFIRSIKLYNINPKFQKIINDNSNHRIIRNRNNKRKNSTNTVNNTINYISITNNNTIALSEHKDNNLNNSKIKGNRNIINIHSPAVCIKKYENIFDKFFEYLYNTIDKNKYIEFKKKFIEILFEEFNIKTEFCSNKSEEEILNCSIKNFIKHDYNFYTNYSNCSSRNLKSLLTNEFSYKHNKNNYTNIENFNEDTNSTFFDSNNCIKPNLYKTILNTNRKNDVKNNMSNNFVHKSIDKKIINHNSNNSKIGQKNLFKNYRTSNKPCSRIKALINSKKKNFGSLTFNNKSNNKHIKKKNFNLTKHNISNDITFKKEEANHIQEKILKLENDDTYKNSEETNTELLTKIKCGLDDSLKKMFNFSYENFLNKESENETKRSYLDI